MMPKKDVTLVLIGGAAVAEAAAEGLPMTRLNETEFIGPFEANELPAAKDKLRALAAKKHGLRVYYFPATMEVFPEGD